jgi:hypothetical protein
MCDLQDLGFKGSIYTWTNKNHGDNTIHSRLDRFLATTDWISMFPNYLNTHLVRYKSDHCLILLDFSPFFCNRSKSRSHYLKKFEQVWTTDADHINIVKDTWQKHRGSIDSKLQQTLNALHSWGSKTFGIIPKRIKNCQQDLQKLQQLQPHQNINSQITNKEKELDELLEKEELWWRQHSRTLWLRHGDKNTKFFHKKASQRRRKNTIDCIKDPSGTIHINQEEIEAIFTSHFQDIFSSQQTTNIEDIVQVASNIINQDMHDHLSKDFTAEEILNVIKDMKSLAAPGPDGLLAKFYHTYWDIIGDDITRETLNILNHDGNLQPYNNTHICLIPKTKKPVKPSDFRPIALCNVTLKIVTKTIVNRLKTILPNIISPNQSAFVPSRLITDNTIIANEIFHYLSQTTRQTGYVSIKTDMAKAYDRLE